MSGTKGHEIRSFARALIKDKILVTTPKNVINPSLEFSNYLIAEGRDRQESIEFAERNKNNLISQLRDLCSEWKELGLDMPLCVTNHNIITWQHPSFQNYSQHPPIGADFTKILAIIRNTDAKSFLGVVAIYLSAIGCKKIFITDTSGDGGIDLIASLGRGDLHQICFFVQAKTSTGNGAKKEALLTDYSKYLLIRRLKIWDRYIKACGLDKSISGISSVFIFSTNAEFRPGIRESALGLEVMLRSGRQIANSTSKVYTSGQVQHILEQLDPYNANLDINLADKIARLNH